MTDPVVYLASPLGFHAPGQHWREHVLLPALAKARLAPADPWHPALADAAGLPAALALPPGPERLAALSAANRRIAAANTALIASADAVLALLDGTDVDSGTAAEIGWAAAHHKPVIGLRTDFRPAGDNEGSPVNLQVEHFIHLSGGAIRTALPDALTDLAQILAA